jgi:small subunit ribosomal protein S18
VDYKDIERLSKLMTGEGRMFSRKRSGNCARHQRMFKAAIKRGRFMALLRYC